MKKKAFASLLLTLTVLLCATCVFAAEESFKVKIPEGLYLYHPKIDKEVFSPLFIVEKGKLIDPYALAKRVGIEAFNERYVKDKVFSVYVGRELTGRLSSVKLESVNFCYSTEFLPDIRGNGRYEGMPLMEKYVNKSLYVDNDNNLRHGSIRAIISPEPVSSTKTEEFTVTDEDRVEVAEKSIRQFDPEAMEYMKKWLETLNEHKYTITEKVPRLDSVKAFDMDGNGKKDLIGVYTLYVGARDVSGNSRSKESNIAEILYVMHDNGTMERAAIDYGTEPAFGLAGVVDIDQDGFYELAIQLDAGSDKEPDDEGKKIDILRHTSSGWESIYRTEKICGAIY